ncbi:MAG: hypothetical protein HY996_01470 [Micrococcales bacterium]|nr:hypothetical protein [Micrococcales bacterium]
MTGSEFPFEADFDAGADRTGRGPIDRRDLILTLVLALIGALLVGATGAAAVVQLAVSTGSDALVPIVIGVAMPLVCWVAGAAVASTRLVHRRRAWPAPLLATGAALLLWTLGLLWWMRAAGLA